MQALLLRAARSDPVRQVMRAPVPSPAAAGADDDDEVREHGAVWSVGWWGLGRSLGKIDDVLVAEDVGVDFVAELGGEAEYGGG